MKSMQMKSIFKIIIEKLPWPIWIENLNKNILYVNKKFEDIYNVKLEEAEGQINRCILNEELIQQYEGKIQEKIESSDMNTEVIFVDGK